MDNIEDAYKSKAEIRRAVTSAADREAVCCPVELTHLRFCNRPKLTASMLFFPVF